MATGTAIYGEPDPGAECSDCGTVPSTVIGVYCPYHARVRYRVPEDGERRKRAYFMSGPLPTHDEIVGRAWESQITHKARRRAERKIAKYGRQ